MHCSKCGNENDADATFCKKCGVKLGDPTVEQRRMGTPAKIGIGCLGLIGAFLVLVIVSNIGAHKKEPATVTPETPRAEVTPSPLDVAKAQTTLEKYAVHREHVLGMNLVGSFTIRNDSPYDVKDFGIHCTVKGASGTVIGGNDHKLYEIVKAHSTRTYRDVDMGFLAPDSNRCSCALVSLSLASL